MCPCGFHRTLSLQEAFTGHFPCRRLSQTQSLWQAFTGHCPCGRLSQKAFTQSLWQAFTGHCPCRKLSQDIVLAGGFHRTLSLWQAFTGHCPCGRLSQDTVLAGGFHRTLSSAVVTVHWVVKVRTSWGSRVLGRQCPLLLSQFSEQ